MATWNAGAGDGVLRNRARCARIRLLATIAAVTATLLAALSAQRDDGTLPYPHAYERIGTVRQMYDGALTPDLAVSTFRNIDRLFPTRTIRHGDKRMLLPKAEKQLGYVRISPTRDIYDFLAMNRVTALLVLKDGKIAYELYQEGNTERTRWMSMSIAKSFTSTLVGAALKDGSIHSINDPVTKYVPRLAGSAYDGVSVRDVLMMSSGVGWNETYTDPSSDRRVLLEAQILQRPGALLEVMSRLSRVAAPGMRNNYSTGETQVAGEIVIGAVKRSLAEYLSDKVWTAVGMEADANWWLDSPDGHEIGGSGISATLRDYGRFGQFYLNDGVADGHRILPDGWTIEATTPKTLKNGALINYGYLWWPSSAGDYAARGIHGQQIYVNPTDRVVIVIWAAQSKPTGAAVIDVREFYDAVVRALR
jgi:CubicO group peptidase (beta-lactamase class C family)